MSILEALSEEEAYLLCILMDPSGVDLAEFCWEDLDNEFNRWRAWPFQWSWYRCQDPLQIDQCGRSVGKSLSIKLRAFSFPFIHSGAEMGITAPELVHLQPIITLIERVFDETRMGREMLPRGRNHGITHRPFQVNFINGSRILGRIPQRDGRGVKGLHPLWLELDEAADYCEPGWTEIFETLKRGQDTARWRCHGVTKGVRDTFYKLTQPESDWTVHRYPAQYRPTWTAREREEKIKMYGSRDNPDYRRNILGEHGDMHNALFVLARLMQCVDREQSSSYNLEEYKNLRISSEMIADVGENLEYFIGQLPGSHKEYRVCWAGQDVGYCVDDQTEILTQRGWMRWNEVMVGDKSLAIDPQTGASNWEVITNIYHEHFDDLKMVEMKGQTFDSLTTPPHRWLVKISESSPPRWRWKTTETLNTKDRIPYSVPRGDCPTIPIYSDDFVELAGWYWTEGTGNPDTPLSIGQSCKSNPEKVKRIYQMMERLYGAPGPLPLGPRGNRSGPLWRFERRSDDMGYFHLSRPIAVELRNVVVTGERRRSTGRGLRWTYPKLLTMEFLLSLTKPQLDLLIEVSRLGDGWTQGNGESLEQYDGESIRRLEIVCALAGRPTSTNYDETRSRWHINLLRKDSVSPMAAANVFTSTDLGMRVKPHSYTGTIWCPTIKNGNWLARRNGSIYFTGNTNHPSVVCVFAEVQTPEKSGPTLKLLTKIQLDRVHHVHQAQIVRLLCRFYHPRSYVFDKTGVGLPLYQELQYEPEFSNIIKGFNFSEKILADIDSTIEVDEFSGDVVKEAGIQRNALEYSSDRLRMLVDQQRLILPWDRDLIGEFQGQTYVVVKDVMNMYGRKEYNKGNFHALDAARMAVLGYVQAPMEAFVEDLQKHEPVYDIFVEGY